VHKILGVCLTFPGHADDEINIYIRASDPGITGISITPSWNWSLTARQFSARCGIDRLLNPIFPGQADSEDASAFPKDAIKRSTQPYFYEAVFDGKLVIKSSRLSRNEIFAVCDHGVVEFRAVKDMDHMEMTPKFTKAVLKFTDKTKGKENDK
jgi:hypothetical protein